MVTSSLFALFVMIDRGMSLSANRQAELSTVPTESSSVQASHPAMILPPAPASS